MMIKQGKIIIKDNSILLLFINDVQEICKR